MDVSSIYTLARTLTYTDSVQMPDATLQIFLNLAYHDLENTIVSQVNEDFFYQEWTADIVNGQREYTFPVKSGTTAGLKKLLEVSIYKTSTDTTYTQLDEIRMTNIDYDINKYSSNQQFYYISDDSVFIYPIPTEDITDGIKLYGISNLGDIATGGAESTIKIPVEYHELIAYGMIQHINQARSLQNEALGALNIYNQKKQQMVFELSDRNAGPHKSELPNLSNYA